MNGKSEESVKTLTDFPSRLEATRKGADMTQKQAAERLGVSESTLRNWEKGRSSPQRSNQDDLIRQLKQPEDLTQGGVNSDTHRDPIYRTTASAGDGSLEIHEERVGYIEGSDALSRPGRDVYWVPVRGDSMEDTISKGTLVPICKLVEGRQELPDDDVYLFRLEGTIQIKRLQRRPGSRIRVVSDNDNYEDFDVYLDEGMDFEILGRVLV